ncbi:zinc finger protein GAI-ASSOCIATED FACTOR 1-like [Daucus carota subsp. sativus]|uniref:zinc finger protein GAI-ASSOCIATED FACTOR 1-like n=1 Tax=Daucus carota subsp. sativus TaxID=79200 RepID=UPI0030838330
MTDPDAEVGALSSESLTAKNRFVCELCDKGFPREQNLQLHRRGHNLPFKLKKKADQEVQKKVYICPQIGCVHHDPSKALGDLTRIKKQFARKHGEKIFNCSRCHKRYVVLSDLKVHSKICGTRSTSASVDLPSLGND